MKKIALTLAAALALATAATGALATGQESAAQAQAGNIWQNPGQQSTEDVGSAGNIWG
ncbi:hypothetical protein GCM10009716_44260 [Streptomyces sodiiphilus]|uniref:Secreted protein n=1 Tax=Streptomyces sodiiphilus TaxID=226217 RepID=A0ABN2PX30_9ACTN